MGVLDWIFPKKCLGCGKMGSYVCETCEVGIWEREQICLECGRQSEFGVVHKTCRKKGRLEGLIILWTDEGMVRKIITNAKKKFRFDALGDLAKYSAGKIKDREDLRHFWKFLKLKPCIMAMPETSNLRRQRGFSFTKVVAENLAKEWQLDEITDKVKYVLLVGEDMSQLRAMRLYVEGLKKVGIREAWGLVLAG